ncbi:hypothetical protein DEQ92_14100 [Haloferax sp. Atlit-6N]|uniref:O-antigen ligase family protein n=1 Tax=Haloferax sp. Atlit-6N TaxID=2077205 RepID=UPI000E27DE13|nr:O-antigen ligase family protein [Haloferax sp. Atlit-6N]REA02034.1 hypothetical protein DEQ92_14100 [Haloferax sp. Atlit-6N]
MKFAGKSLRQLEDYAMGNSRKASTVFSLFLVTGLILLTPVFAKTVHTLQLPIPIPLLVGVAVTGFAYLLLSVITGRVRLSMGVLLVVTSTFAADVPLFGYSGSFPGSLGPKIWLLHLPLVVLIGILIYDGEFSLGTITVPEVLLSLFVLWSIASALIGNPEQRSVALYYSIYMSFGLLALSVGYRCVRSGILDLYDVMISFVIAVAGHTVFGIAQFINQKPFGFSFLGETGRMSWTNFVSLGLLGEYKIGVIISGFSGGSGPLSVLVVMALPITLALAYEYQSVVRICLLSVTAIMSIVLRLTAKDAARAAALISILMFVTLLVWKNRAYIRTVQRKVMWRLVPLAFTLLVSVGSLLYPTYTTDATPPNTGETASTGDAGISDGVINSTDVTPPSIPFFNLDTLGVRLQQYVLAAYLFFRDPIFGIGGGNFPYLGAKYGIAKPAGQVLAYPIHNLYLALLTETGLPGFIFYMSAITVGLWNAWGLYRSTEQLSETVVTVGLLASLVGYLAVLFWVINIRFTYLVPFWLLVGSIVGVQANNEKRKTVG